jgi:hypothetical protein
MESPNWENPNSSTQTGLRSRDVCVLSSDKTRGGKSPQISEADKTRMEMQDWLQMSSIQKARFPHITVMAREFLDIPVASEFLWVEVIFT